MRSNWFTSLFGKSRIQELEEQVDDLEKEVIDLRLKLHEKQEHIDKTNAYWKKKMHQNSKKDKL
jgi:hypothetical protein